MRLGLFLCFMLLNQFGLAAGVEFWKQMATSYQSSGELSLEEVALKKILEVEPSNEAVQERLKAVQVQKESQGSSSLEDRFAQIERTLKEQEGRSGPLESDEQQLVEETGLERKIEGYEKRLRQPGLTEGQKDRLHEILGRLWFESGVQEAEKQQVRRAIDAFERSVHYHPEFQLSHYELGYLYFRIRELARGISRLERFLQLQSDGVLARSVREDLLSQYIKIARKYFFRKDFDNCLPVLRKIMSFDPRSAEAKQARTYLMDLYYYRGMDYLAVGDFENASKNFYEALVTMQAAPELDSRFFSRLARNAVQPFMKQGQKLFLIDRNHGRAQTYFQAVTWLVPGSSESFLAREYMKEIARFNGTAENPVVYMTGLVEEESRRFLAEIEETRSAQR